MASLPFNNNSSTSQSSSADENRVLNSENVFTPKKIKRKFNNNNSNSKSLRLSDIYCNVYGDIKVTAKTWSIMFCENKLNENIYPSVIIKILSHRTGCQIAIKSSDYGMINGKVHTVYILAYCGHPDCPKKFKLVNGDVTHGNFTIFSTPCDLSNTCKGDPSQKISSEKTAEQIYEEMIAKESAEILQTFQTSSSIPKVQSEILQSKYNYPPDLLDLIEETCSMNPKIQKFSVMPFYVATYSTTQIKMLKLLCDETKNQNVDFIVYFDGTDGVVRHPLDSNKFIQYFAIIAPIRGRPNEPTDPFALTEFITVGRNDESIGTWLRSFRFEAIKQLNMWPIINVVILDFSIAQLNAALDAFNGMDILQYLNYMYNIVKYKKVMGSIVKIRLCVSHLIKNMIADVNKNFNNNEQKTVLMEALAAFHLIKNYDVAKDVWKMLCIVLQTNSFDKTVDKALSDLKLIVANHDLNKIVKYLDDDLEVMNISAADDIDIQIRYFNKSLNSQNSFYIEFQNISNDILLQENANENSQHNKWYNPAFLNLILTKYLTYFPLWSCVFYEQPLSNRYIKGYFSVVKSTCINSLNLGGLPVKPLKFFTTMAPRNDFLLKKKEQGIPKKLLNKIVQSSANNSTRPTIPTAMASDNCDSKPEDTEQVFKDSKGELSIALEKKIKITEQTPEPDVELSCINNANDIDDITIEEVTNLLETEGARKSSGTIMSPRQIRNQSGSGNYMPILKNGLLTGKKSMHINTCAFDSFLQCILNVSDNSIVAKDDNWANLFSALQTNDIEKAYNLRSLILQKIYGIDKINCNSNITYVSSYFCKALDCIAIRTESSCCRCNEKGIDLINYLPIDMNKFEKLGITKLQDCITEDIAFFCKKCQIKKRIESITTNNIIFGYVEPVIDSKIVNQNYLDLSISRVTKNIYLSEIPKEIVMFNIKYKISSVVSYNFSVEHYVTYCCQNGNWIKYDDLQEIAIDIRHGKHNVHPHLVVYTKII